MSHDNEISNQSSNPSFEQMLDTYLARRTILKGGLTAALVTASGFAAPAIANTSDKDDIKNLKTGRRHNSLVNFEPVPVEV
jgi:secreted PhoX family phosphatase